MNEMRIGHGYDVHRFEENRRLVIGGVEIPWEKGLLGHSDADVLIHAIMDAILGALGEGDIGKHFPDTNDEYKGVSSINLLTKVKKMLDKANARIINVDSILIMQKPKILPYVESMKNNISFALGLDLSRVNIKATTEEKLGFTGREEGAAAHAVVLIEFSN